MTRCSRERLALASDIVNLFVFIIIGLKGPRSAGNSQTLRDLQKAMSITNLTNYNMSNETLDVEAYLTLHLGDRYVTTTQLIVLNIIYIGIFLSGTIGNICTCIVIARNRNMHTATNYYLMSLAISDLLTLLIGKLVFVLLF